LATTADLPQYQQYADAHEMLNTFELDQHETKKLIRSVIMSLSRGSVAHHAARPAVDWKGVHSSRIEYLSCPPAIEWLIPRFIRISVSAGLALQQHTKQGE
jgi:hypothetical protein